jgi:hypothetical protein
MSKIKPESNKKYPTVGEMLDYIYANDIPMNAIVTCEQLSDFYLEDKLETTESWDYYETEKTDWDFPKKLIPAHNGFGTALKKKLFVIWMHY